MDGISVFAKFNARNIKHNDTVPAIKLCRELLYFQ